MPGRLLAILALTLLCTGASARERPRDLGSIPIDGFSAAATLPDRQKRVIRELACGMEPKFMDQARTLSERPQEIMIAKAAVMAGLLDPQLLQCELTQTLDAGEWDASVNAIHDRDGQVSHSPLGPPVIIVDAFWSALEGAIAQLDQDLNKPGPEPASTRATDNAAEIKRLLNKLSFDTFGGACDHTVSKVDPITIKRAGQPTLVEYRVTYTLSFSCLEHQIDTVILDRRFVRDGNPGSSSLPCHLFGSPPKADWDMSVALLTRLTFMLRKAGTLRALTAESASTMDKLQTRLLTLSGEKAQEVHPIWHCGNPDNQYGSARDRLDDHDFYDPDLARDVDGDAEGSDTGDDFLDFLALLLLLLIVFLLGMALAALAALLAAIFGPILGAILLVILLILAAMADLPQLVAGALFGGIEETENHLFMQNSSKYLKNKMLIEDSVAIGDTDAVEDLEGFNEEIHEWFMERLQRVADNDFAEFNAKPYGRLSFTALLNVHDFTCSAGVPLCTADDAHMVTGVAVVGDLTSAKMALGSSQGRRIVPFRRLSHTNTDYTLGKINKDDQTKRDGVRRLFDLSGAADHQIAAMQLWAGQTFHGPDGHASEPSLAEMSWEATSNYAPSRIVLDLALNPGNWRQTLHHAGWERYTHGTGWLITAGGTESGYAQGFRTPTGTIYPSNFIKWGDRGAGVPTTLMVSSGKRLPPCEDTVCFGLPPARLEQPLRQDTFAQFIRFDGKLARWKKDDLDEPFSFNDNFCVEGSFACGINLQIPSTLRECMVSNAAPSVPSGRQFSVIDSSTCKYWDDGDATNDIFVVVYEQPCKGGEDCKTGSSWGFIEVVPRAQAPTIADLRNQIFAGGNAANFDRMAAKFGQGTFKYASLDNGVITFEPHGSWVTDVSGTAQRHGAEPGWPRAQGDIINRTGTASYTIRNPRLNQQIVVDFSNQKDPKRVLP